ncbi:MAG: molybdenum cofactor biosynthesis protein MoaE [Methanomicrobiaceae archaeon]|nr:molybdenum cofactor biosynthesis protein MoaE [Methanomicrobiaceae archaeon]
MNGRIAVTGDEVDPGILIEAAKQRSTGAIVSFVGVVRDDGIESIEIEAYEEVAIGDLLEIRDEAALKYELNDISIVHRVGRLGVGENILVIVVSAGHRGEAFAGCEYILERIKERAPIWKREILPGGDRWVEGNPGMR